jgi:hypothetical protein
MKTLYDLAMPQMAIEGLSPGEFSDDWMYRGYRLQYADLDWDAQWIVFIPGVGAVECATLCCAKWEVDYCLDGEPEFCPDPIHKDEN